MTSKAHDIKVCKEVVESLLLLARENDPKYFAAFFAGILANVVGNMSDEYWKEFSDIEPCGVPDCDCHLVAEKVMPALTILRKDHSAIMEERAGSN